MKRVKFLTTILVVMFLLGCAPKPFIWQGQYITITTIEEPEEDFKVGKYVIISYAPVEYEYNPRVLYKFAIMLKGKQVGLIKLEDHGDIGIIIGWRYYLEEDGFLRDGYEYHISRSGNHVTYQTYAEKPSYEKVKNDVITILSGFDLEPPLKKQD